MKISQTFSLDFAYSNINQFSSTFLCIEKIPVVLEGPQACGKTSFVKWMAASRSQEAVFVHLDEQIDSQTLLGSYVCTSIPGRFEWRPGVITDAVSRGLWLVIENVHHAPFELMSALLQLLENREMLLPSRNKVNATLIKRAFRDLNSNRISPISDMEFEMMIFQGFSNKYIHVLYF